MKIVVIPDSFKGSLSSARVCAIVKKAADETFPEADIVTLPFADGGEGTLDLLKKALGGVFFTHTVTGACGQPVNARYLSVGDTGYVEFAEVAGMHRRLPGFNAMNTTSYGVGQIMGHAIEAGHRRIVVALGGSCTNDFGCGMAAALGVQFIAPNGRRFVPTGSNLGAVKAIRLNPAFFAEKGIRIEALCDVTNTLYGAEGAAAVYGPQKGAGDADIAELDKGAKALAAIYSKANGPDLNKIPGTGAAGCAGAGVIMFLNGRLMSGTDTLLDMIQFEKIAADADLIITGEGRVDDQTLVGKLVSGVLQRAQGRPAVVLTGDMALESEVLYALGATAVFPISRGPRTKEESLSSSAADLLETSRNVLRFVGSFKH